MVDVVLLLISLGVILAGAEGFTNGVEWLGKKLKLTEGAVGSILAAVGTALPETMIPIVAIIFGGGGHAGEEIGIGAILGAPFMLSTLAFFISGIAVIAYRHRRPNYPKMNLDTKTMGRDLSFFLLVYTVAVLASFLGTHIWKQIIAIGLVIAYVTYAYLTVTNGHTLEEGEELNPLYLARKAAEPSTAIVLVQVFLSLGLIVGGARLFVNGVEDLARLMGVPPFVLALIIAPIATELPEKFNSIIWIGRGKDTLALGNITGAMVFQSSVIPAVGITMTSWELTQGALISAILAIISAGLVYLQIRSKKYLTPYTLIGGGAFYSIFVVLVIGGFIR
ncbi:sodium:calcium antiporter [Neomoorella humiferrea]|uniref:Putative calcium/sodium:proton antiporter n=1 Tax=Neomoorella humiferrea TaxID=676965 RepID=A0A2T0AMW5_9FIRM|nr:sodium:calcium antiporter [Moorella humiferrea]PRR70223.1 putative calcium/sodium:proton antiporter [Moorella humiferrea]